MACLTSEQVELLARGQLEPAVAAALSAHVDQCVDCRRKLDEWREHEGLLRKLQLLPGMDAATAAETQPGPGQDQAGPPPDSFAGYEILREVHRGGQGLVYEAVQKSTKRKVALKVMKEGPFATPAEQARFEREVQILGQLNHPNIVAIHDSGQAAGCHYFVMDYISGQPLDVWAARARPPGDMLKLFANICSAVNAAHLRGITHRDLKPGNIRIDENGEPHILDFGLAKVAHTPEEASQLTLTGQFMGSLPWASPEQAEGVPSKIDIRTDVYSLGVILYQMLTGRFPYEVIGNMRDVLDRIMKAEPIRPSTIRVAAGVRTGRINDEVETIVLKCLAKERERRYQSAGELARDIGRYLAGEPIEAKRDSAAYVLRKYMRKYWVPTAVAVGFVVVVTVGLIGSLTFWRQAVVARGHAEERRIAAEAARAQERQRADELKQVADFQAEQLEGIDVPLMAVRLRRGLLDEVRSAGEKARLDEAQLAERVAAFEQVLAGVDLTGLSLKLLDENIFTRALKAIEKQFADQPLVKARLLQTVADVFRDLGLLDGATAPQTEALAIRRAQLGDEHPDTLNSISNMGALLHDQGKLVEAERYLREALDSCRRALGDDHAETLRSLHYMGALLIDLGRLPEGERCCRDALEACQRVLKDDHPRTLAALNDLGIVLQMRGKLAEAEPYLRKALAVSRRVQGDEHPDTLLLINNLGVLFYKQRKFLEAQSYFREALESQRRVLGSDHPDTLTSINNMGYFLQEQGKLAEAEPFAREALESSRRVLGNDHPDTMVAINNMGGLLRELGRLAEAEAYCREALEARRRVLGDDHPDTLTSINNLATMFESQGKPEEAISLLVPAEPAARRAFAGGGTGRVGDVLSLLGRCRTAIGAFDAAEANLREAYAILSEAEGAEPESLEEALTGLVKLYESWHAAEPGKGYDQKAAEWRAKLEQWQASTQPARTPASAPASSGDRPDRP